MDSDIKLQDSTVEIIGDKVRADVGFGGGTIELNGSNLKTTVTDLEMLYYGGHLKTNRGNMELGSTDNDTFKGFRQLHDGTIEVTGDKLKVTVSSAEIGNSVGEKFKGINLSQSGYIYCSAYALEMRNPDFNRIDSQPRLALGHDSRTDKLLLNINAHYTGGVNIDGAVNFSGRVNLGDELIVKTALLMRIGSKLLLQTPDATLKDPITGHIIGHLPGEPVDLLETIKDLQNTVSTLQQKVTALEAKVP